MSSAVRAARAVTLIGSALLSGCALHYECEAGSEMNEERRCIVVDGGPPDSGRDAGPRDTGSVGCDTDPCPCSGPDDCASGICSMGRCVECTALDESTCTRGVCDVLAGTCTTRPARRKGPCEGCVSDAECMTDHVCVVQIFDMVPGESYCQLRESAAPMGDCTEARPFVEVASGQSISGSSVRYCRLARSSCESLMDHGVTTCTAAARDCGIEGSVDAVCAAGRCALPCATSSDCPMGNDCDTTTTPFRCAM